MTEKKQVCTDSIQEMIFRVKVCLECSSAFLNNKRDPEYCFGCPIYSTTPDNEKMVNMEEIPN